MQRIEDTCSGAVACQLMDCIQPNTVPMSKVNWGAKDEYAMICNYKLLQSAFDRARVSKPVEVNRLIRGKYQDNLEFMQWFKAFYDGQRPVDGYDPTSCAQLREHLVLLRGEVIHDVPEPTRVPRESPTIPGPDRTRGAFGNCRHLHDSMPVTLTRWPAGPSKGPPRS
mgnify:CR=1 FL=1